MLHKGPLLLKETLHACLIGLQVLARHLRQVTNPVCPYGHLLLKLLLLCFGVAQVASQAAAVYKNGEAPTLKEAFGTLEVNLGDENDDLVRLQKIPLWREGGGLLFLQVGLYALKGTSRYCVVDIPRLGHLWMCLPELLY